MVAVPDRDVLGELLVEVRRLRRAVRVQGLVLDAIREAFLVPPFETILAERRALRAAQGTLAPPLPPVPSESVRGARPAPSAPAHAPLRELLTRASDPPDVLAERARQRRAAPHLSAVERIREEGRAAARAALPIGACPYVKASGGYRRAWREGWSEFRGSTASAPEAKP